nr:hypothetical protein [Gammaproteobacteria bacterium]
MGEVGQEDESRQQGGQMLFAMAVVVFELIALGLERVVVSFSIFQRLRSAATVSGRLCSCSGW